MPLTEPAPVQEDTAGSNFGNKEAITSIMFDPAKPSNPVAPDCVSEGKLFNAVAAAASGGGATITSKSCKMIAHPSSATIKSFYVTATQTGTFVIQAMLDESELVGGNPVWRNYTDPAAPIAVAANGLAHVDIESLGRQWRIVFINTSEVASVVNAWAFSVQ